METILCCEQMKENVLLQSPNDDMFLYSDKLICYNEMFNEYGLIINDGGKSYVIINFCPWCGFELPSSERDKWFL